MKIFHEGTFKTVAHIQGDDIYLADGSVIRNKELIKLPFGLSCASSYKRKLSRKLRKLAKIVDKEINECEKMLKNNVVKKK